MKFEQHCIVGCASTNLQTEQRKLCRVVGEKIELYKMMMKEANILRTFGLHRLQPIKTRVRTLKWGSESKRTRRRWPVRMGHVVVRCKTAKCEHRI